MSCSLNEHDTYGAELQIVMHSLTNCINWTCLVLTFPLYGCSRVWIICLVH